MRRILVTGGAGDVGSACVAHLIERGYKVAVYDNLSTGHRQAITRGALLEVGDLSDPERLAEVFSSFKPDFVMHFAASCLLGESMKKPFLYSSNSHIKS